MKINITYVYIWIHFFASMFDDTRTTRNNEFEIKLMEMNIF